MGQATNEQCWPSTWTSHRFEADKMIQIETAISAVAKELVHIPDPGSDSGGRHLMTWDTAHGHRHGAVCRMRSPRQKKVAAAHFNVPKVFGYGLQGNWLLQRRGLAVTVFVFSPSSLH